MTTACHPCERRDPSPSRAGCELGPCFRRDDIEYGSETGADAAIAAPTRSFAVDKLGVLIAALAAIAAFLPFAAFSRQTASCSEKPRASSPRSTAGKACCPRRGAGGGNRRVALFRTPTLWRLATSLAVLALLFVAIGHAGTILTPPGDKIARVSPGAGFWLLIFAFALLAATPLPG